MLLALLPSPFVSACLYQSTITDLDISSARQHANLEGKEDFIKEELSKRYTEYMERYSHMVVDDRSNTHLQVGI